MSNSSNNREDVEKIVRYVYNNILKISIDVYTLNLWVNRLVTKQSTLNNFLVTVISPNINSLSTLTLVQNLYVGVLNRQPTISESSDLVSIYNKELRKYGSKERALSKMILAFVKSSSISKFCKSIGIDNK